MSKKHRHKTRQKHRPESADPPTEHPQGEDGMVYTVRIETHPDEEKKNAEERTYRGNQIDAARKLNNISAWGAGIAFAALVALMINAYIIHNQLKEAKRANDLAYRPYIGVDQIIVRFYQGETDQAGTVEPTEQTTYMGITVQIKNFGPVPGTNYVSEMHMLVGDTEIPSTKVADRPFKFFPGQVFSLPGKLTPLGYKVVSLGEKPLTMYVKVSYDGPTGRTEECEKDQYLPNVSRFTKLGPCPPN